jgi:hypothetical protein
MKYRSMDRAAFQAVKDALLGAAADLLGTTAEALANE